MKLLPGMGRKQVLARLCHAAGVLPVLSRLRALARQDVRILAYHRVLESDNPGSFSFDRALISASAHAFREQMQYVRRRLHPMRFDELLACIDAGSRLPRNATLVTFDDGYDDNYQLAFPILRDLDMSAMFFVSTGHIDSGAPYAYDWLVHMVCTTSAARLRAPELDIDWDIPVGALQRQLLAAKLLDRVKLLDHQGQARLIERLEQTWNIPRAAGHGDCRPMQWNHLREMRAAGMEVGAHGVDHRMLAKMPEADMVQEIRLSKAALDRELGEPVEVMSYPVGGSDAFDGATIRAAREAGFRMACSYLSGTAQASEEERFSMRRLPVEREMDTSFFRAMVSLPEVFSYSSRSRIG